MTLYNTIVNLVMIVCGVTAIVIQLSRPKSAGWIGWVAAGAMLLIIAVGARNLIWD